MDKQDKQYLVIGVAISVIFGIFPVLEYFNVPPENLLPYASIVIYGLVFCLCVLPILFVFRKRDKIGQIFRNKYLNKLTNKIQKDLEIEAKNKQLALLQDDPDFIRLRAIDLATNISSRSPPVTYTAWLGGTAGRNRTTQIVYIGEPEGLSYRTVMPFNEAQILAKKITEISHSESYRKNKAIFYLFS